MKQKTRWSETQLATLKGALADNELAITAIRKVFLEDELNENEEKALNLAVRENEPMHELIRRHYCPTLTVDAPIGQVQDRLAGIPVQDLTPELAVLQAEGVELAEKCMASHVDELITGKPGLSYTSLYKLDKENPYESYVGLFARNRYVVDAEKLTHHLQLLAGQPDETPEQTMERLKQNSTK